MDFIVKGLEGILLNTENDYPRVTFVFCTLSSKCPLIIQRVGFFKKAATRESAHFPLHLVH